MVQNILEKQSYKAFINENPVLLGVDDLFNFNGSLSPQIVESKPYYPQKNDFFFIVPNGLDLEVLFDKAISRKLVLYKIVKFLSLIGEQSIYKRRNFNGSGYDFFPRNHARITSKKLIKEVGEDYLTYYNFLKGEGVINRTSYIVGTMSMGYGYQPHLRYQRLSVKMLSANKLVQKIRPKFNNKATEKYCKNLVKPFRREKFGIDCIIAEDALHEKYCEFFVQNQFGGYMLDDELRSMLKYGAYQNSLIQLVKLLNGQYYFNRSNFSFTSKQKKILSIRKEKNRKLRNVKKLNKIKRRIQAVEPKGRFYSTFSFLPKIIRDLLYFDGEKLEQIDVKNCVIYILSNFLQNQFSFSKQMLLNMTTKTYFASYIYNLLKKSLAENGIELVLKNFKDIQLPLNQFCISYNEDLSNSVPLTDVNSLIFQLGCVPGSNCALINKLPKVNLLEPSGREPKILFEGKLPEINKGSIPLESNSVLNLDGKMTFKKYSKKPCDVLNKNLRKLIFTKIPVPLSEISSEATDLYTKSSKSKKQQPSLGFYLMLSYMNREMLQTLLDKELQRFQEFAVSGIFYEYFIPDFKIKFTLEEWAKKYEDRFKIPYKATALEDRKLTKEMLIALIYAPNESRDYKEIKWAFIKHFPLIYLLINDLKLRRHKQFAHVLFNMEAEVILDKIAKKLLKNKIQCFTVHDCIAVKKSKTEQAVEIMMQTFREMFGFPPQIEFESTN